MRNFAQYQTFIDIEPALDFGDFEVIGYFPYQTASIHNDSPRVARALFREFESKLPNNVKDNKIVVICKDKVNFGTNSFALLLKDFCAHIGTWDQVTGYHKDKPD